LRAQDVASLSRPEGRVRISPDIAVASAVLVLVAPAAAQPGVEFNSHGSPSGALEIRATLAVTSHPRAICPPGTAGEILECRSHTGSGVIPGLGRLSHSYAYIAESFVDVSPATCTHVGDVRILATTLRLSSAGKGDLDLVLAAVPHCMHVSTKLSPTSRAFTIADGTGIYAGASGGGTLKHTIRRTPAGAAGTDTWVGTLVVPGADFDVTPPQVSSAVSRVVRLSPHARSARVRFSMSANDDRDGSLPVTCTPSSGSRFKLGKTRVTCSATDSVGNTARSGFAVTVLRAGK
jgi:hypothetical protein